LSSGRQIKFHRQAKHMTQQQLATGICSIPYLSKIENNLVTPSKEIYILLAERLNLDISLSEGDKEEQVIFEKINLWNTSMIMRKDEESKKIYSELSTEIKYVDDYNVIIQYKVFLFRYFMVIAEIKCAENVFFDLQKNAPFFTKTQKYYCYKFTGIFYNIKGQLNDAIKCLNNAVNISTDLNIIDPELDYYLAIVYSRLDKIPNSIICSNKALDIYQKDFNHTRVADCCMILGINFNLIGDYDKAEYFFKKVLTLDSLTIGNNRGLVYHNLAYTSFNQKNYQEALNFINKSLELKKDTLRKIPSLHLKSLILLESEENKKTILLVDEGYDLSVKYKNKKFEYKFFMLKLRLNSSKFEQDKIDKVENEIIPYFRQQGDYHEYKSALNLVGDLYYNFRLYKSAANAYKKALKK